MAKETYSIAHIAVAVPELKSALQNIEKVLGLKGSSTEEVLDQKVKLQFVDIGGVRFEFLEPTSSDSPISKFIEKRGSGIHHVAIKVKDIDAKLAELKAKGVMLIDEKARIGAEGCKIAFLHPKACGGILVELVQE